MDSQLSKRLAQAFGPYPRSHSPLAWCAYNIQVPGTINFIPVDPGYVWGILTSGSQIWLLIGIRLPGYSRQGGWQRTAGWQGAAGGEAQVSFKREVCV